MKRVLIIDDQIDFGRMLKENLEFLGGYEVFLAPGGGEGLRLASRRRPDLVLLDVAMPGMDGVQVLRRLKNERKTQEIPVFIISGQDPDSYLAEAVGNYAEHIFPKPVNLSELNQRIGEVLGLLAPRRASPSDPERALGAGVRREGKGPAGRLFAGEKGNQGGDPEGKKKVLIVEDDASLRGMLEEALELAGGFEVRAAPDGWAGLAILQDWAADLVITDLVMPNLDGMELICRLRRSPFAGKILAMSGGARVGPEEYLEGAKFLGAHGTLSKPFGMEEFLRTVRHLLEGPSGR